jgi:hypothetical protein
MHQRLPAQEGQTDDGFRGFTNDNNSTVCCSEIQHKARELQKAIARLPGATPDRYSDESIFLVLVEKATTNLGYSRSNAQGGMEEKRTSGVSFTTRKGISSLFIIHR